MTKAVYERKLSEINLLLDAKDISGAEKILLELEPFNPKPLKWFTIGGRIHYEKRELLAIWSCLESKWRSNYCCDGIEELFQLYEDAWKILNKETESRRAWFTKKLIASIGTKEEAELDEFYKKRDWLSEQYYSSGEEQLLFQLYKNAYIMYDVVSCYLINLYFRGKEEESQTFNYGNWIKDLLNMGYLKERIEESNSQFIVVAELENAGLCKAIALLLAKMNKTVYFLDVPSQMVDISAFETTSNMSFTKKNSNGIHVIPTKALELETGQPVENRAQLIAELIDLSQTDDLFTVIGSGGMLDDLEMQTPLRKNFSRFNQSLGDIFDRNISFGWAGNYLSYISKIYNADAKQLVERTPEKKYSIVIPARNSANTLQYTLMSCLELEYPKDEYEIIVCDNSTDNIQDVYNLCQKLNDCRIKYFRTPRDLHLPKSFEYAFLQTSGEFIFSIGSDDAVLPWALSALDEVRRNYPDEDIIQWDRGFYAWSGFNGGQQHQFVIPNKYTKEHYQTFYKKRIQYMTEILDDPNQMYGLPMLYINSGFKRSYMKKLLKDTGRLWDGICQDIYIGVINVQINDQILNLTYPITIAGMSTGSEGAKSFRANVSDEQSSKFNQGYRKSSNVGGFSLSMTERLMPQLRSDVSSLYNSLLRAVARGVISEDYMWEFFDWKKMFLKCVERLSILDVEFDKQIHYARYTASWHGEEFLQWFDEEIYQKATIPRNVNEKQVREVSKRKTYIEGETSNGGLVVDASRYGVTNAYEAVKLFQKLSGL